MTRGEPDAVEVARPVRRAGWRNPPSKNDRALQSDPYTYVPTLVGFLYLAIVLDAFSRRVVGWAMAAHLRTELVIEALEMAVTQRRPGRVIHHSDSEYMGACFRAA